MDNKISKIFAVTYRDTDFSINVAHLGDDPFMCAEFAKHALKLTITMSTTKPKKHKEAIFTYKKVLVTFSLKIWAPVIDGERVILYKPMKDVLQDMHRQLPRRKQYYIYLTYGQ